MVVVHRSFGEQPKPTRVVGLGGRGTPRLIGRRRAHGRRRHEVNGEARAPVSADHGLQTTKKNTLIHKNKQEKKTHTHKYHLSHVSAIKLQFLTSDLLL